MASVFLALVPDGPSGRVDDGAHARLLEGDASIFSPGSTEVVGAVGDVVASCGGDVAVVEDVVGHVGVGVAAVGCCLLVMMLTIEAGVDLPVM